MNVLHIASECVPFCKTKGLADVLGSLPRALQEQDVNLSVILPLYKAIPSHFRALMTTKTVCSLQLGWREKVCYLREAEFDGLRYYFIEQNEYFGKEEIYGAPQSFHEAERFAFFCKAVLEVLPKLRDKPDVLHAHDWQTAFIPYLLKEEYMHNTYYASIKTLFTIYQLNQQGVYSAGTFKDLLSINEDTCEYYGKVNLMKGALIHADLLTTVSKTFADEILTPDYGEGLDGVLREQQSKLVGIFNGIDLSVYDPYTDPSLVCHPPLKEWKAMNKRALQQHLSLAVREVPLLIMVSTAAYSRGIEILLPVLEELLDEEVQVLIIGRESEGFEHRLKEWQNVYKEKLFVHSGWDEELVRQAYAAADLSLIPSQCEPGGERASMAFQYEVVPVVRETGGLRDTVKSFNEFTGEGNGFSFAPYQAHDLLFTVRRALHFYRDPLLWWRIVQNIKSEDHGWNEPSKSYVNLYKTLLSYTDQEVRL
ncbi:glycogen synthase [Pontibacillus chungwhensis BH030062]|uniref:Glycogen synthase n=1 Tax=Pontibacillus chungwhensis BH030062 TaxID=1385513 RepID=A0A0A2VBF0_9BACI|nr:glycogen/starch synthase [Pontibacillus chungwhensis]KGP91005.1 glycogen synthase [Pontibacillus chungwhensis BH030062]